MTEAQAAVPVEDTYEVQEEKEFLAYESKHVIFPDGRITVTTRIKIWSPNIPLKSYKHFIEADEGAIPCNDLKFQITEESPYRVHPIWEVDDPLRKDIRCYFDPEVPKGTPIQFELTYAWDGMAQPLFDNDYLKYWMSFSASHLTDEPKNFEAEFIFLPPIKTLDCKGVDDVIRHETANDNNSKTQYFTVKRDEIPSRFDLEFLVKEKAPE